MDRPILHFPMVRIHDIAEGAREAAKTIATQTEAVESVSQVSPLSSQPLRPRLARPLNPHRSKQRMDMTSLKQPHQTRRVSMASGSIRIPPEDYGTTKSELHLKYCIRGVQCTLKRDASKTLIDHFEYQ